MRRAPYFLGIAVVSVVAAVLLRADLWFIPNTPTGGDMGAHVLGPAFMRDTLLPQGRISGWSNSWFAGFPIFYFYFPLPSLVIVFLDLFLPYGVAFKLVTVAGILATPPAAAFLARSLGLNRPAALVAGIAGGSVVFAESYTIYGGNIPSTMAGEFAFSWSFALGFFALGLMARARTNRRLVPLAALILGLTALSHVLTTLMVIIAALTLLFDDEGFFPTLMTWLWGFALSAFWALPLVARIGLSADMGWSPLRKWDELVPTELWFMLPLALIGVILGSRKGRLGPIHLMALVPTFYYWLVTVLPKWFPDVIGTGAWKLWNGRLIPYWYFAVFFFAGLGMFVLWEALAERLPERAQVGVPLGLVALVLAGAAGIANILGRDRADWLLVGAVAVGAAAIGIGWMRFPTMEVGSVLVGMLVLTAVLSGVTYLAGWARWNYTGYEGRDTYPQYEAFMDTVGDLPPGRVHWEANSELNQFGTTMALMLIPYWTDGTHTSTEGLFFESSLSTPFHFINASETSTAPSNPIPGLPYHTAEFDRGLNHLQFFAVDYYVAFTDEAKEKAPVAGFEEIAVSEPFTIYSVPGGEMVEIATHVPSVYVSPDSELLGKFIPLVAEEDEPGFSDLAVAWYDDLALQDRWVVDEGPAEWPEVSSLEDLGDAKPIEASGEVSDFVLTDDRISFTTTAVGVPHLIKVSYFPNWKAEGADGPYYAAPSFMLVVPTEADVVLEFRSSTVEWAGMALTGLGLAAFVVAFVRRRRPTG